MPETYLIRKGEKTLARITGEGLCFGRRVKPGGLHVEEMIDDPTMLKIPDPDDKDGKGYFVLMCGKGVIAEKI